ncbi:MAG: hypothetical protein LW715_13795, partial [Rhodobacter sp.]|nr:hypothetical protein [Rhodobacter sp.]
MSVVAVVRAGGNGVEALPFTCALILIRAMPEWVFLTASMFMRGIATGRSADRIRRRRRRTGTDG